MILDSGELWELLQNVSKQIGRAGRDGQPVLCLLYAEDTKKWKRYWEIRDLVFKDLLNASLERRCLWSVLLSHFVEEVQSCCGVSCSVCLELGQPELNYSKPKRLLTDEQLFGVSKWKPLDLRDRTKVCQDIKQIANIYAGNIVPYWTWSHLLGSESICNQRIEYRPQTVTELRKYLPLERYPQRGSVSDRVFQI